jgi:calcineurin-like phosphoesterase family protein
MSRYFTADLHMGHQNISAYTGRPFGTIDEMDIALVERWNAAVGPDDEVWVLGDFAMGRIVESLPLASMMHGHKVLVPGNHDRCWSGHRAKKKDTVDKWITEYEAVGFRIVNAPLETTIAGHSVVVDHFPYKGDSTDTERYCNFRPVDRGQWLLHGHIHESWLQRGRQINVGVDAWGGMPVSEDQISELIKTGPLDLAPLPW